MRRTTLVVGIPQSSNRRGTSFGTLAVWPSTSRRDLWQFVAKVLARLRPAHPETGAKMASSALLLASNRVFVKQADNARSG